MTTPISSLAPELLRLWGKTGPDNTFHPALFHMLDVGHVAQLLLSEGASPRIRNVMVRAFQSDLAYLSQWLPLVVALHDIGKISAPFQGQNSKPATQAQCERLLSEGFNFGRLSGEAYPHNNISAVYARHFCPENVLSLPESLMDIVRDALSGHHGVFATSGDLRNTRNYMRYDEPSSHPTPWAAYRDNAVQVLASTLAPMWSELPLPQQLNCRAATLMLTGFIILCDWIGSDSDHHFPITDPDPISFEEYIALSRKCAHTAVASLDFLTLRQPTEYVDFATFYRKLFTDPKKASEQPRPLQLAVDDLPLSALASPALFIVEGPTGEGKTELALALAQRLASLGSASDELYFGLPTMATSDQMFIRLSSFMERIYGSGYHAKLIHGQAFLVENDLRLSLQGDLDSADVAGQSATAALQWFAPKKKALLWPFGVGTVDQIELTTLNARHYMLRLFGLAGKVVIIDEVHAYDVYMSTILQHALRWLANLGTSVILLSATLPSARHIELARSFREGLTVDSTQPPDEPPHPMPYPALAAYTARDTLVLNPPAAQEDRKLYVQFVHESGIAERARLLLSLAEHGGAACYVCNIVQEAQDVYRELAPRCSDDIQLILIHSRFPLDERQALEKKLRGLFGPDSKRTPEERFIVIGTQVLEQSLDVDFDVMFSDMVPIDLLLQRAGRMHRHLWRARPAAHQSPKLFVRLPLSEDEQKPSFSAWATIYDEYILWRTWLTLIGRGIGSQQAAILTLPADYRLLIEETYSDYPAARLPPTPFADIISATYTDYQRQEANQQGEARNRLIPPPDPISPIIEGINIPFKEDEDGGKTGWGIARTRLGEERVTVIPLHIVDDSLSVDPYGKEVVGAKLPDDRALQLRLLWRSIPVSHKRLVPAMLRNADAGPTWFRNPVIYGNCIRRF